MVSFNFWVKWLSVLCGLFAFFGIIMALLSWSPLFAVFGWLYNGIFWPGQTPDAGTQQLSMFVYGMLGGVMAWLGIILFYVVKYPFARKEQWSSNAIILGLLAWFVTDTFMSAYTKVYLNVFFNVIALIMFALPIFMTRKEFR